MKKEITNLFKNTEISEAQNFNSIKIDVNDASAVNLSDKISSSFIDFMKEDMAFISGVNFIETKDLDKELLRVRESLKSELKTEAMELKMLDNA